MTAADTAPPVTTSTRQTRPLGRTIVRVITSTDHKVIGNLYLCTSFGWFLIGGIMAMIMRSELANPGMQFVNDEVYNQLFTMHGTIMLLLFATPLFFGFGNAIMPLQIGSPDVAFPRLNTLNQVSTVGAFLLGASMLPFFYNVWISRHAPLVEVDDPWGWGRSLEWATSCPPPRHNFDRIPRIRSESPAFDLHHPEAEAGQPTPVG